MPPRQLSDESLDLVFRGARTHRKWIARPVEDETIRAVYDLMRLGPTSANCGPARLLFIRSEQAKERLRPCLSPGNIEQTMNAPVTAIIAYDRRFYEFLPRLYRQADARSWFAEDERGAEMTAFRNSSLQGAYFIVAARSLGLDCGPMSGFDNAKVDAEFFPDTWIKSNFLCNLGYGDASELEPRNDRLTFDEACTVL
ncbi:MAG: malonic semialdehyde reductase [Alphaproteobacteria bacterium]